MQSSKKLKKKYKALILDLDGTLIPNKKDGMPSKKVRETIAKASKLIHIGVATSRPYFMLSHIFKHLKLSGPLIISGGSQILDIVSKKTLWEQVLNQEDLINVCKILKREKLSFFVQDNQKDVRFSKAYKPKKPFNIYMPALTPLVADNIINKISHISTIAIYKIPSWKKNKADIHISHVYATKQHAILEVAKILGINTHEIIGVGDGGNDMPLLMACGLKVAMGNAVEDLKAIADYIAPSVEEDGVADVIEKFVL